MKATVLDIQGKKIEDINLNDEMFGIVPNLSVLAQYVRVYRTNQRQGTSSTLTRAEVSGGGKKPWAQKGTGRARHGSTRSPIWVHGGVAFGPKPKNWHLDLPKKMVALAFKSALSLKFKDNEALIVDGLKMEKPSTKDMKSLLEKLNVEGKVLFVWQDKDENIYKSLANLNKVQVANAGNLNAYELLSAKKVIFTKEAVLNVETRYAAK